MRLELVQAWTTQGPRDYQEDAAAFTGTTAMVADGVGGGVNGDVASKRAVKTFLHGVTPSAMRRWIDNHAALKGGATTVAHVELLGGFLHVSWSGDSRVTLIRDGKQWSTKDHCELPPHGNVLTQCLQPGYAPFSLDTWRVKDGDIVMLTTDGVHDYVPLSWVLAEREELKEETEKHTRDNATCLVFRVAGEPVTVL